MSSPLVMLFGTVLVASSALAAEPPIGDWVVPERYANVRIESCGDALWGVVSGVLPASSLNLVDPELRRRLRLDSTIRPHATLGVPVLIDMRKTELTRWGEKITRWEGRVYRPESGKTYEGHIRLLAPNILKVEFCEPGGIFCSDQRWAPVHAPSTVPSVPRFGQPKAATPRSVIAAGDVCSLAGAAGRLR